MKKSFVLIISLFTLAIDLVNPVSSKAIITETRPVYRGEYIQVEGSSAIYRINESQQRQYFLASWIFKCYQPDYSNVVIFPKGTNLDELAPSAQQGVVPPKAGCGLAKSTMSPSVYAFDEMGIRHKIKDEATALALYGDTWAKQIHDMPDFIISLFPIGNQFDETNHQPISSPKGGATMWKPTPGTTWEWQLDSVPETDFKDVAVYDIDYEDTSSADVKRLHDAGKKVICYVSVGSWENWRLDAQNFPKEILGNDYDGWAGEKWLDIRATEKLYPLLQKRFDECKDKGFDGIEPDNIDGYDNDTGFDITAEDQIIFNKWLASEAHKRGLSIGLKNDPDQVSDLEPYFDWALTEDCTADGWCSDVSPFIEHNKSVFMAEYLDNDIDFNSVCSEAQKNKFSFILKNRDLDANVKICR